jgi:hypothetical protein
MAKIRGQQQPGGTPPNEDEEDDDISPKHRELIVSTVNAAVTAQLGRKLSGAIADAIGPALEPITQQLSELGGKLKGGAPAGAGAAPGAAPGAQQQGGGDPAVAELTKTVADLQAKLKAKDEQAEKDKLTTSIAQRDAKLTELLTGGGVDKLRLRCAAAVVAGSLVQQKDGSWKYKAQRDGYEELIDPDAGVKEWLESDEGKAYIPATAAAGGGSGARPKGKPNAPGGRPMPQDPKVAKAERKANALGTLMSMVQQSTDGDGVVQLTDD